MRLSRHAKNSMRLYDISRADVEETIASPGQAEQEGERILAYRSFGERFSGQPLKVVYVVENDETVIITAYPLKRSYRRR